MLAGSSGPDGYRVAVPKCYSIAFGDLPKSQRATTIIICHRHRRQNKYAKVRRKQLVKNFVQTLLNLLFICGNQRKKLR
jgi:hypothetical protein